jgi:ribosomal protein L3 glutamine methyltransferase
MPAPATTTDELLTVRDWLRYAVSRFNAAQLVYGHGTANALDEAAYLILHTLHLPVDQLEPWLEARLLGGERQAVREIIEARITKRKPAPYLTHEAWIGGHAFYVDERVIVPRSYIGELLTDQLAAAAGEWHLGHNPGPVAAILDLCTGSGCLAILAALAFPQAVVDASDVSIDALAVAARNVADYGLEARISLSQSNLFEAHAGRRYDLILANPPYVAAEALAAFPPEYAAEPQIAHAGGVDGLDLVRRILAEAGAYLAQTGALLVEIGAGREPLAAQFQSLPFRWLDTADSVAQVFALPATALP